MKRGGVVGSGRRVQYSTLKLCFERKRQLEGENA